MCFNYSMRPERSSSKTAAQSKTQRRYSMSSSEDMAPVRLIAHAQDENTRIDVLDGNLNVVPGSSRLGETTVDVPPGAYAVRFQIGSDYVQRVAICSPNSPVTHVWLSDEDAPRFTTSAPVRKTS